MTITCSYGTWNRKVDSYTLTLEQSVGNALNGEYTDKQIEAVTEAYRDAINAALPDSVSLCGNQLYGPYTPGDNEFAGYPQDDEGDLDIAAIVESVDFWATVEQVTDRPKPNRW
jgi:hypothetical protein